MVVNEFFKSIARTLGRLFAYLLLGILAYFIFTWFNADQVKAQTLTSTYLNAYGTNNNGASWSSSYNNTNTFTLLQTISNHYYVNGVEQYFTYNLNNQTYLFDVVITFTTYFENMPTNFTNVIQFNGVQATCDSTPNQSIIQTGASSNRYTYQYRFNCYIYNTTSGSNIYYNWYQGAQQTIVNYQIEFNLGTNDKENADIIAANNANTDRILQSNYNNATRIIQGMIDRANDLLHSNGQTQQAVYDNTQAVETLDSHITSESEPNVSQLETIGNMRPIDTPITDIITLPISILNKEIQSLGGTCNSWNINTGSLLGNHTWTFPCINIGQYFQNYSYSGYNLWQLIDLMICLYMGYEILMLIVSCYNKIANLEDPFSDLYKPKHEGYAMKHGEGRL